MKKLMLFCGLVLLVTSAQAPAVSVTDVADAGGAPDNLNLDQVENELPQLFEEQQGVELSEDLAVDIDSPGSYSYAGPATSGTIPAGTIVTSYLVHYDPLVTYPAQAVEVTGCSITFDTPILGLIFRSGRLGPDTLGDSDGIVGSSLTYWTADTLSNVRGFDLWDGYDQDPITLSADRLTVSFDTKANTIDEMRILVAAEIEVKIDIKPGSFPNSFNINGKGVIPVAILGSDDFDVTCIDPESLTFSGLDVAVRGKDKLMVSYEDVSGEDVEGASGDGYVDMVIHFQDNTDNWELGSTEGVLKRKLYDECGGTAIYGAGSINVVQETVE